ncbi:MAG: tRNA pseudouridine(38-40) synthase TruA [Proteobacteria bacterium]|nr:tRNA pseudouridine(38-40) synthase TruA [Pseudomonadota bacterium]MBU2262616.1 tRNA pseudouridine(38-40) synthase TruA [Pseudomonadota bacterium]
MIRNIRLIVEYDGSAYCGWQRQENGISIQQLLEESLGRMTGEEIRVVGSGRTDAGVHALRQVAHFRTASRLGERNLLMGINSLLPADIAVLEVRGADPSFHARFSVKSKVYLYRICNRPVRPALERNRAWFVWEPLDLARIGEALPLFRGTHDFTSFCSTHTDSPNRIRTILAIDAERDLSGMVHISLEADGFLRYMVRTIVGTLVDVGRGKLPPEEVAAILQAKDRRRAGLTAPAHGLFLKDVIYG